MNKGVQVDDGKGGGVLMKLRFCGWIVIGLAVGCGGDARLEMSAADALLATADQMELTIQEYHEEVSANDDSRESEVVSAFVARVLVAPDDAVAIDSHVADFKAALRKIRADRVTEFTRRGAALDNVDVLRELATGLHRLAIESLTLRDELRRYLHGWIETRRRASAAIDGTGG